MTIEPDTKDWTWILDRPCPECGFDARAIAPEAVAALLRDNARAWPQVLARAGARARPSDAVWSPLEYGCHVRDVLRLYDRRLELMLTQDDPRYPNWDQDATAVADRYGEQDPATVAREVLAAGETISARFDGVAGDQWQRTGTRSDGAGFTVASFARYLLHDVVHHSWDVTAGSAAGSR